MEKTFIVFLIAILSASLLPAQTPAERAELLRDKIQNSPSKDYVAELNELLSIYQQAFSESSPEYADALLWAAMACAEAGDNKQGQRLLEKSDILFKQLGGSGNGRNKVQEIFHADLRSQLYYNSGAHYDALKEAKRSLALKKDYFGADSEPYMNQVLKVSRLYAERMKYRQSNRYHNEGYSSYVELIKQEFCSTSESGRTVYWEKAVKYINKTLELAHQSGSRSQRGGDRSLASAAYNAMLLSKGLLLNTTVGFDDYIIHSGNETAIKNLRLKKELVNKQAEQHVLDSLDFVILQALQQKGQKFNLPHLSYRWQDVAERLGPNDLAIEFYKTTKGSYGALLLKKTWKSPKLVRLANFVNTGNSYLPIERAINTISLEKATKSQFDDLWNLGKAIWTDNIVKHFPENGEGRIYFSADGELLMTGIEYLPFVKPGKDSTLYCISDLFPVYRLSSTRELVLERDNRDNHEAVVYGGLRYDMEYEDIVADARLHQSDANVDLAYLSMGKERALREADAIDYLEGTKMEADSIVFTINKGASQMLHAVPYTGEKGTEISFKRLSNHHPRLIHVATHGYFYNEEDSTFNRFNLGNHPLVRSGLLFAGADYKWFGETLPAGIDDGFLTALEISNLDFRGLDLVVLSACETGKGSIKGDGVFGLQRGFKMASVNSILMSLWKVDDEATCLLMTEFYKHWIGEGKTKHDALEIAKQAVRSHNEKGWDKPKYWSAFILLDALD